MVVLMLNKMGDGVQNDLHLQHQHLLQHQHHQLLEHQHLKIHHQRLRLHRHRNLAQNHRIYHRQILVVQNLQQGVYFLQFLPHLSYLQNIQHHHQNHQVIHLLILGQEMLGQNHLQNKCMNDHHLHHLLLTQ